MISELFGEGNRAKKDFIPTVETIGFNRMLNALYGSSTKSCVFAYVDVEPSSQVPPDHDANVYSEVEISTSESMTKPLQEYVKSMDIQSHKDLPPLTQEQIDVINHATTDQAKSTTWHTQRHFRITASNIHNVFTKMKKVEQKKKVATESLVKILSGTGSSFVSDDMRYGTALESEARHQFEKKLKKDGHKNLSVKACGLIIHKQYQFIAASPDGLVSCSCCAERPLEIKCPSTLVGIDPSIQLHSCLGKTGGSIFLKQNHPYFSQIQTEMAVTGSAYGDFVIYSRAGMYHEVVPFKPDHFDALLQASARFFDMYLLPAAINSHTDDENLVQSQESNQLVLADKTDEVPTVACDVTDIPVGANVTVESETWVVDKEKPKKRRQRRVHVEARPVYVCEVCMKECMYEEDMSEASDESVQCDICFRWYHMLCVDYQDTCNWHCLKCI